MPNDLRQLVTRWMGTLVVLALLCAPAAAQGTTPEPADDGFDVQPYDPAEAAKRIKEFQEIGARMRKLLQEHPEVREKRPEDFARAYLKVEKCALLVNRYMPTASRDASFRREFDEARAVIDALEKGVKPPLAERGLIERAYLSDVDRSAQPYYVYIGEKHDLAKPAPLVLFLHGYIGNLDKVNWLDQTMPESMKTLAEKLDGILLAPFARSNTDFLGLGERDVLHTIDLVKRDYRIDADRVFLCGASMGASGTWAIAAHYPHLFAAAVPAAGRSDYNLWQNVPRGTLTPFKQWIIDRDYAMTLVPNFRNLPVFAFHGANDWVVKPDQSRRMVLALAALGFEANLREFEGGDHWSCFNAFEDEALITWLKTKRRATQPTHVSYSTYHPRLNRAWWVTIDDFAAFGKPAEVDVKVLSRDLVEMRAENVARVTLDTKKASLDAATLKVRLTDGRVLKPTALTDGRATFLVNPVAADAGGLRKRGEVSGPIYEAYQVPFVLVYGTGGDEAAQEASRNLVSGAMMEWFEFAAGVPRVKKDTEVNADDLARFNLVLFGTPESNAVLRRIAPNLPITIAKGKYTIGAKTYEGDNLGFAMVYPNPLNPDRLVVVHAGTRWGRGLPRNHKLDLLPDFIVYDDTVAPVSGTNTFKVAGFFDINWKLDPTLTWIDPEKTPPPPPEPEWPVFDEPADPEEPPTP